MPRKRTIDLPCELRIRMSDVMASDIEAIASYTGMDYTNLTRMALFEYIKDFKETIKS